MKRELNDQVYLCEDLQITVQDNIKTIANKGKFRFIKEFHVNQNHIIPWCILLPTSVMLVYFYSKALRQSSLFL